jgi:hypothetical protein
VDLAFPCIYVSLSFQTARKEVFNTAAKAQLLKLDALRLYSHLITVPGIGVCLRAEGARGLSVGIVSCVLGAEVGGGVFAGSTNCPASYTCVYGYGS